MDQRFHGEKNSALIELFGNQLISKINNLNGFASVHFNHFHLFLEVFFETDYIVMSHDYHICQFELNFYF